MTRNETTKKRQRSSTRSRVDRSTAAERRKTRVKVTGDVSLLNTRVRIEGNEHRISRAGFTASAAHENPVWFSLTTNKGDVIEVELTRNDACGLYQALEELASRAVENDLRAVA
jgi:hypothetical protein